jgi:hypothetical protein
MSTMLWLAGALVVVVVGIAAWNYPRIKSGVAARRRAAAFRALAGDLGVAFADASDFAEAGFWPTLQSIFGPHGELHHVILREEGDQRVHLFEYRFGARPNAPFQKGVAVVAVRLPKPGPMFTLVRPRGPARSRTTEHGARGQRLVVQALNDLELWSLKGDKDRARKRVRPILERVGSWNIRGVDEWLVMFNEQLQSDLPRFFEEAEQLRRGIG